MKITTVPGQMLPTPGVTNEVKNNAGGYVYQVSPEQQIQRFLVLGSPGSYYASAEKMTADNIVRMGKLIDADPDLFMRVLLRVSGEGRAPKVVYTNFALAMMAASTNQRARFLAFEHSNEILRTASHLLEFISYVDGMRGWGRGLRNGVAKWYTAKSVESLAFQVAKYANRAGWTHADVMRKIHLTPHSPGMAALLAYIVKGTDSERLAPVLRGLILAREARSDAELAAIVTKYGLTHEMTPTENRGPLTWAALLPEMPPHALTRNLGTLTRHGVLERGSTGEALAIAKLNPGTAVLPKFWLHPFQALLAMTQYQEGHGDKGASTWDPNPNIVAALETAFYSGFKGLEVKPRRVMLAVDCSGSMQSSYLLHTRISANTGAAAMAMVLARSSVQSDIFGFGPTLQKLPGISGDTRLANVAKTMQMYNFGTTDCAAPMTYALKNGLGYDAFVVITDSETWVGKDKPVEALRKYRAATGLNARLVVIGMTATEFTIADPTDPGMLDVVGFDAAAPGLVSDFVDRAQFN